LGNKLDEALVMYDFSWVFVQFNAAGVPAVIWELSAHAELNLNLMLRRKASLFFFFQKQYSD
jgi:hypothetical protein